LHLGYRAAVKPDDLVNVALTVHQPNTQDPFCVCDAVKMGAPFENVLESGFFELRLPRLPLGEGRYRISARVTVNEVEADSLPAGVGYLNVAPGDYYGTGRTEPYSLTMLDGEWEQVADRGIGAG
jgi:hypothetical protein